MKRWMSVMLALGLAGCAGSPATPSSLITTVSTAETALASAGQVVMACYAVPACEAKALPLKPQIKTAYDTAYSAVTAAQSAVDSGGALDMTAANNALSTLKALVAQLPQTKT